MVSPGIIFTERRLPAFTDVTDTWPSGAAQHYRDETSYLAMEFKKNYVGNSPVIQIAPNWPWRTPVGYGVTSIVDSYASQNISRKYWDGSTRHKSGFFESVPGHTCPLTASGWVRIDGNLEARAITECLNKLNSGRVNYGNSVAEANTTLRHLGGALKDLSKAYFALKRGDVGAMARALGKKPHRGSSPANAWLEYQYAWKPLFQDIHGAVDDLTQGLPKRGAYFSVVRNVRKDASSGDVVVNPRYTVTGSGSYSIRCKVYARMGNEQLANLSTMGLVNPLAVAWELMPYSFVVDWVLPVGNVLNAITAPMGLIPLGHTIAHRVTADWSFKTDVPEGWAGSLTPASRSIKAFHRTAGSGFPLPRLYWKSPWSGSHVTSALSLLTNLAKSRLK